MDRLVLCGWIRGVTEKEHPDGSANEAVEVAEKIARLRAHLLVCTGRGIRMFSLEGGASFDIPGLRGHEVISLAQEFASAVAGYYKRFAFYHTCSFGVTPHKEDVHHHIFSAKRLIDRNASFGGVFFLDGRLFTTNALPERTHGSGVARNELNSSSNIAESEQVG
jgi:hypothetical protein